MARNTRQNTSSEPVPNSGAVRTAKMAGFLRQQGQLSQHPVQSMVQRNLTHLRFFRSNTSLRHKRTIQASPESGLIQVTETNDRTGERLGNLRLKSSLSLRLTLRIGFQRTIATFSHLPNRRRIGSNLPNLVLNACGLNIPSIWIFVLRLQLGLTQQRCQVLKVVR